MCAADRAVRVLAQPQFAELHAERIHQQQPPDERFTGAQDELDDFGRLNDAEQSWKNSQHATFGAGGNQSGRWRLRIEAAITRTVLGGEYAGLAFEAKNGRVNVGLAGKHAGVVDQIT